MQSFKSMGKNPLFEIARKESKKTTAKRKGNQTSQSAPVNSASLEQSETMRNVQERLNSVETQIKIQRSDLSYLRLQYVGNPGPSTEQEWLRTVQDLGFNLEALLYPREGIVPQFNFHELLNNIIYIYKLLCDDR